MTLAITVLVQLIALHSYYVLRVTTVSRAVHNPPLVLKVRINVQTAVSVHERVASIGIIKR